MGGKSTYLRQAALIILMAQMGSFVPGAAPTPSLTHLHSHRASDIRRALTFLVEMSEVRHSPSGTPQASSP